MTDTITDSFCERCGIRYTFEKADKPRRVRLGRVRVLTRGLTTFVANDGLPMAEAMAAARNDVERAALSSHLDAFHKTFNFCMTCRQYTCPSCWNETAGECLTCAPDLSREVLPPAFPDLPIAGPSSGQDAEALAAQAASWPSADLDRGGAVEEPALDVRAEAATTGIAAAAGIVAAEAAAPAPAETPADGVAAAPAQAVAPADGVAAAPAPDAAPPGSAAAPDDAATSAAPALDSSPGAAPPVDLTAAELAEIEGALALARTESLRSAPAAAAGTADAEGAPDDAEGTATVPGVEPAAGGALAAAAAAAEEVGSGVAAAPDDTPGVEPAAGPKPAAPVEPSEHTAVARDQTRSLLRRFRPGRGVAASAATPEAVDGAAEGEPRAPLAAVEPEPRPAPVPEPAPLAAAAEPAAAVPAAEAAPSAVPVAPAPDVAPPTLVPPPVPGRPHGDTIQQPTWQMVAPDNTPGETESPGNGTEATPPAAWPTTPGWSSQQAVQPRTPGPDASPWAARLAASRPETGGIWAASSREVLSAAAAPGATPAVQACVSCGLSLSATARFCRRCGTRQG
jgi:hypothetical protein